MGEGIDAEGASGCTPDLDQGLVTLSVSDEDQGKLTVSVIVGKDLPAKRLSVALRADDGHSRIVWSKPIEVLAPEVGGEQTVTLDLDDVELDLSTQRFSGMVRGTVSFLPGLASEPEPNGTSPSDAEVGQGSDAAGSLQSDPLFFHREGDAWRIYDAVTLHSKYARGDLNGDVLPILEALTEQNSTTLPDRITEARAVDPSLERAGDEGPVEGNDAGEDLGAVKEVSPLSQPRSESGPWLGSPVSEQDDTGSAPNHNDLESTGDATHGTRTLCVRSYVTAQDSSIMFRSNPATPFSIEEDWTNTTGDDSASNRAGQYWKARNTWMNYYQNGSGASGFVYLDTEGCTNALPSTGGDSFVISLLTSARDAGGNQWDVYTGTCVSTAPCPESTPGGSQSGLYSFGGFATIPANSTTTLNIGPPIDEEKWLMFAVTAFAQWRVGGYLTNSKIHLCEQEMQGGSANTINTFATKSGCIDIGTGTGSAGSGGAGDVRLKYLVAHELGHAIGYLYALDDFDGAPSYDDDDDGEVDPWDYNPRLYEKNHNSPFWEFNGYSTQTCDVIDDIYNLYSYEWNALALREAFAHLVATRIFNDREENAVFVWGRNSIVDSSGTSRPWKYLNKTREQLDEGSDLIGTGGRIESTVSLLPPTMGNLEPPCCPAGRSWTTVCREGSSTVRDWTGALWNWYTAHIDGPCAPGNPGAGEVDFGDVLGTFELALALFDDETEQDKAYAHFYSATVWGVITPGIPTCSTAAWESSADHFGANN